MFRYREIIFIALFITVCTPPDVRAFTRDMDDILAQQVHEDGQRSKALLNLRDALSDTELSVQLLRDHSRIHAILLNSGLRLELLQHPLFMRQMLRTRELRQELLQNEQMMREMLRDRDIRCELERNCEMMAEIEKVETYRQEYMEQEAELLNELLMDTPGSGALSRLPAHAHEQDMNS